MYKSFTNTSFLGKKVIYLPSCQSTNDIAADFIRKGEAGEGSLVITSEQTAARGQRGNSWESSPYQNLTFSLVFTPTFLQPVDQFQLSMAVSLGIRDFLSQHLSPEVKVKWPNDLYFREKKLCGILIENQLQGHTLEYSIAGIGLNINQQQFTHSRAGSLSQFTGKTYVLNDLLEELLPLLEHRYLELKRLEWGQLKATYQKELLGFQAIRKYREVASGRTFRGQVLGINQSGQLAIHDLDLKSKVYYFKFKEVEFLMNNVSG
ncbi:biotin--[acetyl-CoA-carboxylase] ligase [Rapidithrix thailandica]|uniref:Biotin--[acetyl-CoA-carboxylase] ligase n=1 Tax=Rapidithrix thailandica TaxID=413964 RepID=A0AAW9S504_9BACT